MGYSHLVFDFDHLLFDTDRSEALAFDRALTTHGVTDAADLLATYQTINQGLWRQVERGTISPNDVKAQRFVELAEQVGLRYDAQSVSEEYTRGLAEFGELYSGADELVRSLADSHTLAMVTNGLGSVQRGRLQRLGLIDVFQPLVISGERGVSKPRREIFELVFAANPAVPRGAYLMIGDSLTSDIQGGMNAGIDTCWYNPDGAPGRDGIQPTHTIGSLQELPTVVRPPHT